MSGPGAEWALDDPALARLVTERVRRSRSSFYWGMRMLERRRRLAMYAIYAFCREVDDIADGDGAPAQRLAGLDVWRRHIEALYSGRAGEEITRALAGPVGEYALDRADFLAVIDGCAMDARGEMVRPSESRLDLYCDRVACAVGRLSVRVFGEAGPAGLDLANTLGRALQLTNILRDLREDADMGRLYLPDELLARHGIAVREPTAVLAHPSLGAACAELAGRARTQFAAASTAMARCSRRAMRPAALMAVTYRDLLGRCERGEGAGIERVRVPPSRKLWYLLRHGIC